MTLKQRAKNLTYVAGLAASISVSSLFVAPKANALTFFTQTTSFSNQVTELAGTPVLTLDKYNPQPGEIVTDVKFTITATLSSSGTVTNTAANPQTFTVRVEPTFFDLTPGANAPAALQTYSPLASYTEIGRTRYTNLAPNTPTQFGPFTINNNASPMIVTFSQPIDIAGFLGTGTFSFEPFTEIFTGVSGGGGNVATNITTLASASITVEYNGTSNPPTVPFEFSSNVAIGSFVGIMFGLSWWKRKCHIQKTKS
ncbi:choice-of-anchor E domain-containing protein [Chlorogloeopsis sp. ULAP01]|uniref:choice-of-anchor E domain-containing protein n=1 Tax=Chlorogloeopsis sp. ULAP01 TaxID=3056483 RepID=UPI0025AB1DBC|nr:choice-of-anchor E domain-containing protein [Chlorogloeopsis sp. ULAP01]MDM9383285.1 choice-of-anchor E domain-containing protein [Chlorogloeopsis sp. ULAP01]